MTQKCLAAHTPHTGYRYYPPYFNASLDGEEVVLTVRSPESEDGACGTTSAMRMPAGHFRAMLREMVLETARQAGSTGLSLVDAFREPQPNSATQVLDPSAMDDATVIELGSALAKARRALGLAEQKRQVSLHLPDASEFERYGLDQSAADVGCATYYGWREKRGFLTDSERESGTVDPDAD